MARGRGSLADATGAGAAARGRKGALEFLSALGRHHRHTVEGRAQRLSSLPQPIAHSHSCQDMGRIGPLTSSGFEQFTLPESLDQRIQQPQFRTTCHEPGTALTEHSVMKARVCQCEAKGVFPVNPPPYRSGSTAVREVRDTLQHCRQRQPCGGCCRLPTAREQIRILCIGIERAKHVGDVQTQRPVGEGRTGNLLRLCWNRIYSMRMDRQRRRPRKRYSDDAMTMAQEIAPINA